MVGLGLLAFVLGAHVSLMIGTVWLALSGVQPASVRFLLCGSHKPMNAPDIYSIGRRICFLFSWLPYNDVVWGWCLS